MNTSVDGSSPVGPGGEGATELVVFVGLQGAGKSSWYRQHYASTHVHVSKDRMRNNRNRERRQLELVRGALAEGLSVVVDNTNPDPASRAPLLALAAELGARRVAVYFDVPLALCLERNARRRGREQVPVVGILATSKRLAPPRLEEGFDAIRVVSHRAVEPAGTGHPPV